MVLKTYINDEEDQIVVYAEPDEHTVSTYITLYNGIVEDLKKNNIFDYNKLGDYKITVYCNEKTKELVRK